MTRRTHPTGRRALLVALTLVVGNGHAAGGVVVIGDERLKGLDARTVERIYLGLDVEVNGIPVTPVNVTSGSPVRDRFLQTIVNKSDDDYKVKWISRRYRGLGAPPREVPSAAEMINVVKTTPGAIGYVDEADVPAGVTVLLR
jgi:ABC-type phosphate transport system substrate-binding protein